jgi:hypothetical protein
MVFLSRWRKELRTGMWTIQNKESRKPGREIGIALALSIGPGKRRVLGTGVASTRSHSASGVTEFVPPFLDSWIPYFGCELLVGSREWQRGVARDLSRDR